MVINFGGFCKNGEKVEIGQECILKKQKGQFALYDLDGNEISSFVDSDCCTSDTHEFIEDEYLLETLPKSINAKIKNTGWVKDYDYDLRRDVDKCWFNMDISFETTDTKETRKLKKYERLKKKTLETINKMIDNVDKGMSGCYVDEDGGCGNPRIFKEFEEGLKHGNLVQIPAIVCPYERGALLSNGSCKSTGCYHNCGESLVQFAPAYIIKNILIRYREALLNDAYKKIFFNEKVNKNELPKLITNEELEIAKKAKEEKFAQSQKKFEEKMKLQDKSCNEKSDNRIVFNGSNLNPLPRNLFLLWNKLSHKYEGKIIGNFGIYDYDPQGKEYISRDILCSFDIECDDLYYHDFDSSITMSLYHDYVKNCNMFMLVMVASEKGTNTNWSYKLNRNEMYIEADERLEKIYNSYKELKKANPDKWN
jgi:hypothetical protein